MSSTFRHVMPLDDAGVTGTEVDFKRISKHQRQQLVDRGARESMSSLLSPFHHSCTIQGAQCLCLSKAEALPSVRKPGMGLRVAQL